MLRRDGGKAAAGRHARGRGAGRNGGPAAARERIDLAGVFAAPGWLRDLGGMAWLLVGVAALVAGVVVLMSLTSTIVVPVITAGIAAAVLSPAVHRLERRHLGRAAAAAIVFALIVAVGLAITLLVLGAIVGRGPGIERLLNDATATIQGWVQELGVSPEQAEHARADASGGAARTRPAPPSGPGDGVGRG